MDAPTTLCSLSPHCPGHIAVPSPQIARLNVR